MARGLRRRGRRAFLRQEEGGDRSIAVQPVGGLSVSTLVKVKPETLMQAPHWAPDGRALTFTQRDADGRWSVRVVDLAGTVRVAAAPGGIAMFPSWSADGKRIAFQREKDGPREIWAVAAEGGEPASIGSSGHELSHPEWSPTDPADGLAATAQTSLAPHPRGGGVGIEVSHARVIGNVVGGSLTGIMVSGGSESVVQGNRVGTDATGTANLGTIQCGILLTGNPSPPLSLIGGLLPGEGNVVAFSGTQGITVDGGTDGWTLLGNSIFGNLGLGISLGGRCDIPETSGYITRNDHCDADGGSNNQQNFPVITSASQVDETHLTVSATLDSTPNATFRIEFFANAACNQSGNGEGQTYLGAVDVTTGPDCGASFGPFTFEVPASQASITATATLENASTSPPTLIETSEFSACVAAEECQGGGPAISTQPQSATVCPGGSASFSVVASGPGPFGYQWRKGGNPIAGATDDSYSSPVVTPGDAGGYDVEVCS